MTLAISARFSPKLKIATLMCMSAVFAVHLACAQSLPIPSRTVYKCVVEGKKIYSDSPCLGAMKIEVEPTRGVNKLSGQELIGANVRREQHREAFAEAIRPLTGIDAKQFETQSYRIKLPAHMQQECRSLDRDIPVDEYEEKRAVQPALAEVQAHLFAMRQRFRELRC